MFNIKQLFSIYSISIHIANMFSSCSCSHGHHLHAKSGAGGDNWVIKIFGGGDIRYSGSPLPKVGGHVPPVPHQMATMAEAIIPFKTCL